MLVMFNHRRMSNIGLYQIEHVQGVDDRDDIGDVARSGTQQCVVRTGGNPYIGVKLYHHEHCGTKQPRFCPRTTTRFTLSRGVSVFRTAMNAVRAISDCVTSALARRPDRFMLRLLSSNSVMSRPPVAAARYLTRDEPG